MLCPPFLPDSAGLEVQHITIESGVATVLLRTTGSVGVCPLCGEPSTHVHSHYTRTLADLPCCGSRVQLSLQVRRFFCVNSCCKRKIFAERVSEIAKAGAHRTCRLCAALRRIGFACGGERGSRLAEHLAMPASADTLLRLIRQASPAQVQGVTVLGVDDWAWRKGQRYGTILCDLQSHRTIDLLPERSASTFSAWLFEHPGVQIVSRDRAGFYAEGARDGAPNATQVADRFHLVHNVHEALTRVMHRHHRQLREAAKSIVLPPTQQTPELPTPGDGEALSAPLISPAPTEPASSHSSPSRDRRQELYRRVIELHEQNHSMRSIARELNIDRGTVQRFIDARTFPERATRPYPSRVDRFEFDLRRRWDEGCRNAAQLHRELVAQGFKGSYFTIRRRLNRWRDSEDKNGKSALPTITMRTPSAKSAAWLLLRDDQILEPQDRQLLDALLDKVPELQTTRELANEFCQIVREHRCDGLDAWIEKAHGNSVMRELRVFADGIERDYAAVKAALTLNWSNGQVEGQVNRLKLLKREMYGRAKFDLLRQRVLNVA